MKILFLTHAFYPMIGGLETVARVLAEEFVRLGHEVRLVTQTLPASAGPGASSDGDTFPFPVYRRPGRGEMVRLSRWCDVFFQNNISLQTLWPLLLVRRPWVVCHQTWLTRVDGSVGWQDRLKRFLLRFGTPVAVSRAVAEPLPPHAELIGNPYQAGLFRERPEIERDLPLVFLGRLVSDKGADLLLEALAILRGSGFTPKLTIVGDGPELPKLKRLAEKLEVASQTTFLGIRTGEELVRTLNRHRVLVASSRLAEPFGVVALEGIACGCVVIGSAQGGLADAIGPCGLTFPNHDANALASVIQRALTDDDLRREFRSNAPRHLEKHSPRRVAEAYISIFERNLRSRA